MSEDLKTTITNKCPNCRHKLDAAICYKDVEARPSPGDLSMCFHCYAILQFNNKLKLKKINLNNLSLEDSEYLLRMQEEAIKAKAFYKGLH